VADHRAVDPRLGTLQDFDAMVEALHAAGIKVIVDIVPNHTSGQHGWFQEALAAPPGSPARERYLFRDGRGPDGSEPPSDWESVFGGPAWARTPDGQWYHHIFAPEQPDLNWENREVREDFLRTLRFWSDRGVDGFRVDVAHGLVKDMSEPYRPNSEMGEGAAADGDHPWWDRDEVHEVYAEWRRVFEEYDPPRTAVAEAWVADHRRARYATPEGLGQAFNFSLLEAGWDARAFHRVISESLEFAQRTGASSTWVLSNHDVVRHASRYGLPQGERMEVAQRWLASAGADPVLDAAGGLRRARAATLLMLALPGSSYLYQGEELGLHEVAELPEDELQDPTWVRSGRTFKGRDGCRVPLPWTAEGSSYGFGDGGAHLPQPAWFRDVAVSAQADDPASTLSLYRTALRLRRQLQGPEELEWLGATDTCLHLARPGGWQSVTNFGTAPLPMAPGEVLVSSTPLESPGVVPGEATVWLRA
jgi:alpha-glucosidase